MRPIAKKIRSRSRLAARLSGSRTSAALSVACVAPESFVRRVGRPTVCRRFHTALTLVALVLSAWTGTVAAQGPDAAALINREYAIKAAFVYHFLLYVEWPEEALPRDKRPYVIGMVQTNPFGATLDKVAAEKTVGGHPIEIRVLKPPDLIDQCHILFVPKQLPPAQLDAVLRAARSSAILLVGETDDFIDRGGDVQFFVEGNKVRFAFSADLTRHGNLKVSSKLLALAKIVPAH
ncbi:MAG: YfiR family protein [Pirellulales bacterium]